MIYLEMNHVRKSFGDLEVLKDISLKVEEGEVLSIIGPSGSGKSTLLRCAAMLETMDGGDLAYLGEQAVKLTVLLTNMGDFADVNEVYGSFFGSDPPARVAYEVSALPKGARVEIDAIVAL